MEAGREMDALIAEKVMGWRKERDYSSDGCFTELWFLDDECKGIVDIHTPCFSTDISDAWQVIEKLSVMRFGLERYEVFTMDFNKAESKHQTEYRASFNNEFIEEKTAPLAICLAALFAAGFEF